MSIERPAFFCHNLKTLTKGMVNIGLNIKEELQRQERTVSWLARKLNCTRAAVYRIFDKNSIDTALLVQISNVLHRNFFIELLDDVDSCMNK